MAAPFRPATARAVFARPPPPAPFSRVPLAGISFNKKKAVAFLPPLFLFLPRFHRHQPPFYIYIKMREVVHLV